MTRQDYLRIGLLAVIVGAVLATLIKNPGYTDAYYYFNAAQRLVTGKGLTDAGVWTYIGLPETATLPVPSHLYWMPLTSLVSALPMLIAPTFDAAQIVYVPLFAALVLIAMWLGQRIGMTRRAGWLAGLVMLFSGYFMPFWFTSDAFTLYGVVGAAALIGMGRGRESGSWRWYALSGICIGLAHLTRNDGLLLLFVLWIVALWPAHSLRSRIVGAGAGTLAYLLVMLPWFLRNLSVIGTILPVGGLQTAWMREYNDLFNYPGVIDFQKFLAWGIPNILRSRFDAFFVNLQTAIAVESLIVLAPFILIALWARRRDPLLTGVWLYALGLHAVMTVVFPFPGARGGLFHSAAALMPFWAALGIAGLLDTIAWAAKRRRWPVRQAQTVFGGAVILWAAGFSVLGALPKASQWNSAGDYYVGIGVSPSEVIMINDPAAYYYFTGGSAVVLPNVPAVNLATILNRFKVTTVVLDENVPVPLEPLWRREDVPFFLEHRRKDDRFRVYRYRLD